MIKLEGVVKSFPPEQVVLNGINLEVEKGEWVWLLGVTGVGKSVLVKLVSGALSVDAGKVTVLGEDVPGLNEARLALLRRRIFVCWTTGLQSRTSASCCGRWAFQGKSLLFAQRHILTGWVLVKAPFAVPMNFP